MGLALIFSSLQVFFRVSEHLPLRVDVQGRTPVTAHLLHYLPRNPREVHSGFHAALRAPGTNDCPKCLEENRKAFHLQKRTGEYAEASP